MEWLQLMIDRHPRRAMVLGKTVFLAGSIAILGAVFARAELMAVNGERAAAKLPMVKTLAEAFPQYPTALVPEGPVGFVISALLVLVGMAVVVLADKAVKRNRRG
ncbi:MAG: hypothetical protein LCH79_16850 [Proteobacteria bacterium]|nr:hypothetical protein [Pseudomonadota bacterium]